MKPAKSLFFLTFALLVALLTVTAAPALGAQGEPPQGPDEVLSPQLSDATPIYGWSFERPDDPQMFFDLTSRYLRFDSAGRAHVAYGGDHLYYAYFDGGWHQETVDPAFGVGRYASLALDKNNRPHISYYDAVNGTLKYAYYNGSSWELRVVDGQPLSFSPEESALAEENAPEALLPERDFSGADQFSAEVVPLEPLPGIHPDAYEPGLDSPLATTGIGVGLFTSIAIKSNGDPGIGYYDAARGDLRYASRSSGAWTIQTVDRGSDRNYDVGTYASLAFDTSDRPQISYRDESNDTLKFANYTGSNWAIKVVDNSGNAGAFSSLALDKNNRPHISYYAAGTDQYDLKHAFWISNSWKITTVDSAGDVGSYSSIVVDNLNRPWVSYYDATTGSLKVGIWNDDKDILEPRNVLNGGRRGLYSTIAVDGSNNVAIVYFEEPTEKLQFVFKPVNEGWRAPVDIALQNRVGVSSSMDKTSTGTTYISYFNDTTDKMLLAVRSSGDWTVIDRFPNGTGQYTSLKVDAVDHVHIAYYDQVNGDLRYAFFDGATWVDEVIDSAGDVGMYPSLAIDSNNRPYVAYYDKTNGDLKYALRPGGPWQVYMVDGVDDNTGEFPSLALSTNNLPHIAYYDLDPDATKSRLKYTTYSATENRWVFQTVDTGSGMYPSLALEADGTPRIAYYYRTLDKQGNVVGSLRFAAYMFGAWNRSTLDSTGVVGLWPSLAIASGEVHISYYDQTRGNLKYAHWMPSGWTIRALDTFGDVGMYSSIYVGSDKLPQISYYDKTNGDLKVAFSALLNRYVFLPLARK